MSKSAVTLLNHVLLTAVAERWLSQISLEKTILHVPERKTCPAHLLLFTKCWHRGLKELVFCKVNVFLWVPSQQQFADVRAIQRESAFPLQSQWKKACQKKLFSAKLWQWSMTSHCLLTALPSPTSGLRFGCQRFYTGSVNPNLFFFPNTFIYLFICESWTHLARVQQQMCWQRCG